MSKYGHKTINWLEAVVNKLGGEEKAEAFLRGETTLVSPEIAESGEHFQNLRKYPGQLIWKPTFIAWRTISIGNYRNPEEIKDALQKVCRTAEAALSTIDSIETKCSLKPSEVDLVICSVQQLGFWKSTSYSEVCNKAFEFGLELCPAEVGPALRMAYKKNQPRNQHLRIAMKPIRYPEMMGVPARFCDFIFDLLNDKHGPILGCSNVDSSYGLNDEFVFVIPRK